MFCGKQNFQTGLNLIGKIFKFKNGYGTSPEYVGTFVVILLIVGEEVTYRYRIIYPESRDNYVHNIETREIKCLGEVYD